MKQEEKAKAYDKAIERAKKYWNSPRTCVDIYVISEFFPELAESEEWIRSELISLVRLDGWHPMEWTQEKKNKMIAWLEKQGQKPYGQRKECLDCQFNYAGECKGSCAMKRSERKFAWSEEDEEMLNTIIADVSRTLRSCGIGTDEHTIRIKAIDFLKSLRLQSNMNN